MLLSLYLTNMQIISQNEYKLKCQKFRNKLLDLAAEN